MRRRNSLQHVCDMLLNKTSRRCSGQVKRIALPVLLIAVLAMSYSVLASSVTSGPLIISSSASPEKVYPGQDLEIIVAFTDDSGLEHASVTFPYEGGEDVIEMSLSSGDANSGVLKASWKVHDTVLGKRYVSVVTIENNVGLSSSSKVEWDDPRVSHPLHDIDPGTFQDSGDTGYTFWSSSTTDGSYALGAKVLSSSGNVDAIYAEISSVSSYPMYLVGGQGAKIEGDLVVDGTIMDSCIVVSSTGQPSCTSPKQLVSGGAWAYTGASCHLDSSYPSGSNWVSSSDGCSGKTAYAICC
jgi:hypothetical protein